MTAEQLRTFCDVFEANPDAIVIVDADGTITEANPRVEELFGYEPAELEGEPIEILVPEGSREDHVSQRDGYLEDPSVRPMGTNLDLEAVRKDGSAFPVDISLSPIIVDGDVGAMAVVRDITEHRALRRKYRTVLETAPDMIIVADAESGELLEANGQVEALLGYDRNELLGAPQSVIHPSQEEDRYRTLFENHVTEGRATDSQFPDGSDIYVETKSGEHIPVEVSARVFDLDGRRVITGLFHDISERRAYEQMLEREIDRLELFTSVMSHDLQNPLSIAQGYAAMAQEKEDTSYLDDVLGALDRMEGIINDVLLMAREPGLIAADDLEPADLQRVAEKCVRSCDLDPDALSVESSPTVHVDRARFRHVLENLFQNAAQHAGDEVTVRIGGLEDGFFVEDDGPGIPAADRDAVFEPNYSTSPDGNGLGLMIVSELAKDHGWDVELTEGSDGGARFEFTGVTTT